MVLIYIKTNNNIEIIYIIYLINFNINLINFFIVNINGMREFYIKFQICKIPYNLLNKAKYISE